ncbi:hypothetical protein THIOM_000548 [Candidatus Thiomargarita nelsonii]|uniref:Uncharacterized protein n=1 Tax=Candidatus Thiomargarita nelsonii TaxID=1003181 RepID=A0A176S6M7_9GAMM|nr:hypothetical protein THIOM_000548 [Candidatus Thiomargarita nelsonii]
MVCWSPRFIVVQKSSVRQKILFLKEIVFLRRTKFIWITISWTSAYFRSVHFANSL